MEAYSPYKERFILKNALKTETLNDFRASYFRLLQGNGPWKPPKNPGEKGESRFCFTRRDVTTIVSAYTSIRFVLSKALEVLSQPFLVMQEPRKYMLDKFQQHLRRSFEVYCKRHDIKKTEDHFIAFLIDQNLITAPQLQRFTVCKEFEKMCVEKGYSKSIMVDTLANRFSISERTVWTILKHTKLNNKSSEG